MEQAKGGETSIGEEPNAKRHKRDPNAPTPAKSVVLLFDSDVTVGENGKVGMPNTIEMAQIKKTEKGRFVKISFSREMSEEDVHREICSYFPILSCKTR